MTHHYSKIMRECARTIKAPRIPYARAAMRRSRRSGQGRRAVAAMYLATRHMPAWDIPDTKKRHDAAPLLRASKGRAAKIPRPFIADGPDQYHITSKAFYTLKGIGYIHIGDIRLRNLICNTNGQVSLNVEFASRFKPACGTNKEEPPIFRIAM